MLELAAFHLLVGAIMMIALLLGLLVLYAIRQHRHNCYVDTNYLQRVTVDCGALFSFFQPHLISMDEVASRGYSSLLLLTQQMIGIQPICDSVLTLWPPSFDCYNILIPNSLNIPEVFLGVPGSVDIKLISLAMYASSRASECAYCTSHCCSFAVRRGVDPAILRNLLTEVGKKKRSNDHGSRSSLSSKESAVIKLAYGLGTVPCSLTAETFHEVKTLFNPSQLEWLVASTALFGMFNKLMDGLNIPLETSTYQETIDIMDTNYTLGRAAAGMIQGESNATKAMRQPPPPTDDWTNIIAIMYQGLRPGGALWFDRQLLHDIPTSARDCGVYLQKRCGCSFLSVLRWIRHDRFRRAVVYVIGRNFVSDNLPLMLKVQVGLHYCEVLGNAVIAGELKEVLTLLEKETQSKDMKDDGIEPLILIKMGKALSYAPSRVTPKLVKDLHSSEHVTPAMIVELVSFLAVLQTLHRIISFQIVLEECHVGS